MLLVNRAGTGSGESRAACSFGGSLLPNYLWSNEKPHMEIKANYGQKDPAKVAIVKSVFASLKIDEVYKAYEEESFARISALIETLDDQVLPKKMFYDFMNRYVFSLYVFLYSN